MVDNYFQGCPAVMSDGRIFSDYRTATRREEFTKYSNGIVRDDIYRLFLEDNADKIMDQTFQTYKQNDSCS